MRKIKIILYLIIMFTFMVGVNSVKAAEKVCCVNGEAKITGDERDTSFNEACSRYYHGTIKTAAECKGANTGNSGNNGSGSTNTNQEPVQEQNTNTEPALQPEPNNNQTVTTDTRNMICCNSNGVNLGVKYIANATHGENDQSCIASAGGTWYEALARTVCLDSNGNETGYTQADCASHQGKIATVYDKCPNTPTVKKGICCMGREAKYYLNESNCLAENGLNRWEPEGTCLGTGAGDITISFDCNDSGVRAVLKIVKTIYLLLKYVTPIILVIMGSIDFMRATMSGNAENIDKNKKRFFNRLFIAAFIFLLASIVQLITNILGASGVEGSNNWASCFNEIWIALIH